MSNDIKSFNKKSKANEVKKSTIKKKLTYYANNTFNSFGKMILSNYKTSPNYSFGKSKKLFKQTIDDTPGPSSYNICKQYIYSQWDPSFKFGKGQRLPLHDRNRNPGPGKYDVSDSYNKLNNKIKGISIGKEQRFKKENLDDNLFLPDNY